MSGIHASDIGARLRALWARTRGLFGGGPSDRELDDELASHMEMQIDDDVRRGMSATDARRRAVAASGGIEAAKEAYRDRRGMPAIETLARDIKYGVRSLLKTPGLAVAVIATLAIGVGSTTVMFSIVNGILIDPLPFGNSDRLVWTVNRGARPYDAMAPLDMRDWARLVSSFQTVGSWAPTNGTIDGGSAALHVSVAEVTDNWFSMLGVRPQLGRGFAPGEQGQGAPKVVVLSDGLWRTAFGGDTSIVGRTATIDGAPYTVVGVAPRGFDFPDHAQLWRPIALSAYMWNSRGNRVFRGPVALLKPGVTFVRAEREARVAAAQMRAQDSLADAGLSFDIQPLQEHLVGDTRAPLVILLSAVGALLLIACVNVATLLLVRASARSAELGVRLALGAGRARLVSQLLVESLLLAVAGGLLGALFAVWGVRLLVDANIGDLPLLVNVRVDGRVLAFSLAVTAIAGVGFGLLPALQAARTDVMDSLRSGIRGASAAKSAARTRASLVAIEVALVVPLLIGASLLGKSFSRLVTADPGFRAERLVRFDLTMPQCGTVWLPDSTCAAVRGTHYNKPEEIRQFTHELLARLRALPGTQAASAGAGAPFTSWAKNQGALAIQGRTAPSDVNPVEAKYIAPGYFTALGTSIVQGRDFTEHDFHGRQDYCSTAAIVSEGAVKAYFGDLPPLSARLTGYCDSTTQVVGVAKDLKTQSLSGSPEPVLYRSLDEAPIAQLTVLVRSTADLATVMTAARRTVADLDRSVPVYNLEPMAATIERAAAPALLSARVVSGFAVAALLLAVTGIYGLIAHVVRERRREFGIRIALGARPQQVVALTLRSGLIAVLWGIVPGIAIAAAGSRVLRGLLYGIGATDAPTYAMACVALVAVAVAACWLPARRAARIDPTIAMRAEY